MNKLIPSLLLCIGLVWVSCDKDEVEKVLVSSINLTANKDYLFVGETLLINLEVLPQQVTDSSVTWSSSDTSIAVVSKGTVTGLKAGKVSIYARANDASNLSDSILLNVFLVQKLPAICAKWNVNNTSEYVSFEFNESGNYIVIKNQTSKSTNNQIILFGTYTVLNRKAIELSDLGTFTILDMVDVSASFSLQLIGNSGNALIFNTTKSTEMASTAKTDLLCKTWKMLTVNEEPVVGTEMELVVLFSKAGTYLVTYVNPEYENDGGMAHWMWKDATEAQLLYSWDEIPVWDDSNYVDIPELTETLLKIKDEEATYSLVPLTNTKSTTIKPSGNMTHGGLKSGFFKK
jgi:hypothetical protein